MADLIELNPVAKGNFIVDFFTWLVRVWAMAIILMGGGCFALYVVGMLLAHLLGVTRGAIF